MCTFPSWVSREDFLIGLIKLENNLNTQEPTVFLTYEQQKAAIIRQNLSPEDYQRKMKALAEKLGV